MPAGEVGGDLFDLIPIQSSSLVAAVGGVSGKGIPAAILMAGVQASLKNLAVTQPQSLPAVAEELNRIVLELCPENAYATLFCAQLEPARKKVHYFSAGYESALLIRGNGEQIRRLDSTGTVFGLTRNASYRQRTVSAEPGDVLAAFTDGVEEQAVLEALRRKPDAPASELVEEILEGERAVNADRTLVIVRHTGSAEQSLYRKQAADLVLTAA